MVFYSPIFKITDVNVAIADFDSSKVPDLIGADPRGQNLIFYSPILDDSKYPEVKDLKISKNYFRRAIEISGSVRGKKIVWCFKLAESPCFWADETGYIFAEAPNIEGGALRVVNDYRETPLNIGEVVLPSAMFDNLNSTLDILNSFNLPISDVSITDIKLREFTVSLDRGPKMIFSLDADPEFIKPVISSLIKSNSWSKITSLNLTVEGRAYPSF